MLVEGEHYICLRPQSARDVTLVIGFRHSAENVMITRSGTGAGDVNQQGTLNFLGQKVSRDVLVYKDVPKAVLYNSATEIKVGDLIFTVSLDDFSSDYEAAKLSGEVQTIADKIVMSVELSK